MILTRSNDFCSGTVYSQCRTEKEDKTGPGEYRLTYMYGYESRGSGALYERQINGPPHRCRAGIASN